MNDREKKLPQSFAETVQLVEQYALKEIAKETKQKKLYYHTVDHAYAVKRRAKLILAAIEPNLDNQIELENLERLKNLIELSAIVHDMVQEFIPPDRLQAPRKKLFGLSENATVTKLFRYIKTLNRKLIATNIDSSILFKNQDLDIIQQAIQATICEYDSQEGSIYQSLLYQSQPKISVVARIIALSDLGTLGIEGREAYLRESVLIFLEENLDLVPFLLSNYEQQQTLIKTGETEEIIRTRLLKAARFLVNFAKGRQARFKYEIKAFNQTAQQILEEEIFLYLNPENIQKIEAETPTNDNATLTELLNYFQFSQFQCLLY